MLVIIVYQLLVVNTMGNALDTIVCSRLQFAWVVFVS